jgi:hypothetical protein
VRFLHTIDAEFHDDKSSSGALGVTGSLATTYPTLTTLGVWGVALSLRSNSIAVEWKVEHITGHKGGGQKSINIEQ